MNLGRHQPTLQNSSTRSRLCVPPTPHPCASHRHVGTHAPQRARPLSPSLGETDDGPCAGPRKALGALFSARVHST